MQNALKALGKMEKEPEYLCYIVDDDFCQVDDLEGDYCPRCAEVEAKRLEAESGGEEHYHVVEESSPERDYFAHCEKCGCPLYADFIVSEWNFYAIDDIADDLRQVKTFADIDGTLAWRVDQLFAVEEKARSLFPKQMNYISRRITNLYNRGML